jgi:hypothetical protein
MKIPVSELMGEFGFPSFTPHSVDAVEALLLTAGLSATPPLVEMDQDDFVTLTPRRAPPPAGNGQPVSEPKEEPAHRVTDSPVYEPLPYSAAYTGTNRLARISHVLSLVWLFGLGSLLAILCGGLAQLQIDESGERGRDLATAGIVLGVIGALAAIGSAIVLFGP